MNRNSSREYLSDREVAAYLGISVAALRARRLQGRPPVYVRLGRSVRYAIEDIEAWVAKCRVEGRV